MIKAHQGFIPPKPSLDIQCSQHSHVQYSYINKVILDRIYEYFSYVA